MASAFSTKVTCGSSASGTPSSPCVTSSMPAAPSSAANSRSLPALFEASTTRPDKALWAALGAALAVSAMRDLQRGLLLLDQRADAALREVEQRVEFVARERRAFGRALHFDHAARARHDDVHVGVALRVFGVVEVEHGHAFVDAHRDRRHVVGDRRALDAAGREQFRDGVVRRDERARDGGRAGAAVGLQHVAIEVDGACAERFEIEHRAHRAADQALDFLGAARLLAARGFAVAARVRGARQHAVFGGEPALALVAQERRHALRDARGAQHLGVAEFNEHRPFGVLREMAGDADVAKLVGGAAGGALDGLGHRRACGGTAKEGETAILAPSHGGRGAWVAARRGGLRAARRRGRPARRPAGLAERAGEPPKMG
ncbi:hypothetical protein PT2222_40276 [Paraburkholderia tropica]